MYSTETGSIVFARKKKFIDKFHFAPAEGQPVYTGIGRWQYHLPCKWLACLVLSLTYDAAVRCVTRESSVTLSMQIKLCHVCTTIASRAYLLPDQCLLNSTTTTRSTYDSLDVFRNRSGEYVALSGHIRVHSCPLAIQPIAILKSCGNLATSREGHVAMS